MKTKLIAITLLAIAVGGACPSDVNNDGSVGIQDFLQVLSAWGPCPNATVVDFEERDANGGIGAGKLGLRLWCDNTFEITVDATGADNAWDCDESFPHVGEWIVVESPPLPLGSHPVALAASESCDCISIAYSDGTVYRRTLLVDSFASCSRNPNPRAPHNEILWVGEWTLFTGVPK